jgi:hypothetical protein
VFCASQQPVGQSQGGAIVQVSSTQISPKPHVWQEPPNGPPQASFDAPG